MGLKIVPTSTQWNEYGSTQTRGWRCLIHFRDDYITIQEGNSLVWVFGLAFLSLEKILYNLILAMPKEWNDINAIWRSFISKY